MMQVLFARFFDRRGKSLHLNVNEKWETLIVLFSLTSRLVNYLALKDGHMNTAFVLVDESIAGDTIRMGPYHDIGFKDAKVEFSIAKRHFTQEELFRWMDIELQQRSRYPPNVIMNELQIHRMTSRIDHLQNQIIHQQNAPANRDSITQQQGRDIVARQDVLHRTCSALFQQNELLASRQDTLHAYTKHNETKFTDRTNLLLDQTNKNTKRLRVLEDTTKDIESQDRMVATKIESHNRRLNLLEESVDELNSSFEDMEDNQDQFKNELSDVTEKVNDMNESFDSMMDAQEEFKNDLDGLHDVVDELADSVDEIGNELGDVRDTANAAFSKTEELEASVMDITSDIERLKLMQESFEDTIDVVRELKETIELLEERQNETNENVAIMDLEMKETVNQMNKRINQLSDLGSETNKIAEQVNDVLKSMGITDTLAADLDLTYGKALKTQAIVDGMSLELDDAKLLLEEFDELNMQLSRQVDDLQNAIDTIKETKEEDNNAELEGRIMSLELLVSELEVALQAQNEQFSSGQAYIDMLERESEIDMNRDGRNREKLKQCLKTMIDNNKDAKEPNDSGFRRMLKFLEDGKNFTQKLEDRLIESFEKGRKKGSRVKILGVDAIAIILSAGIPVQEKIDEMVEFRTMTDEQFASGEGKVHCYYKKSVGNNCPPVGSEYLQTDDRYVFNYRIGSRGGTCLSLSFKLYQWAVAKHLQGKRDSLLTNPVKDKATECELKYLLGVTKGYGSNVDCCHKSHDAKDVNPTHLAPQPPARNKNENNHNFCSCDCEQHGYRKCVRLCKEKTCDECNKYRMKEGGKIAVIGRRIVRVSRVSVV